MKSNLKLNQRPRDPNLTLDALGLFYFFAAIFIAAALATFRTTDPSWFTSSSISVNNFCGLWGAYIASILIQFFGLAAFIFAPLLALLGIACFRRAKRRELLLTIGTWTMLLLTLAATLAQVSKKISFGGRQLPSGGISGTWLKSQFENSLGQGGTILLSVFLLFFAISLATRVSPRAIVLVAWWAVSTFLLSLAQRLITIYQKATDRIRAAWLQRQMLRAKIAESEKINSRNIPSIDTAAKWEQIRPKKDLDTPMRASLISRLSEVLKNISQKGGQKIETTLFSPEENARVDRIVENISDSLLGNPQNQEAANEIKKIPGPEIVTLASRNPDAPTGAPLAEAPKGLLGFVNRAAQANGRILRKAIGNQHFTLPPVHLLKPAVKTNSSFNKSELIANSQLLEEKIRDFKVQGSISAVKPGPVITIYEFKPGTGVKVNTIANLADDLALALSAQSVRIEAPIPGRDVVGIEVPNADREDVSLKEIIDSKLFRDKKFSIPIAIGKDTMGEPVVADLKKMPHMLVAGATGSGKSVFVNSLICSLLYRFSPKELKLILVDPKQLELAFYDAIPHLLLPVVVDAKKASLALRWAVNEMERRYQLIARSGMRDIDGFNQRLAELGEKAMAERLALDEGEQAESLPKIVIVIDELADLMMTARADVENNICRLAQKARAAGIHLVLATQRPSVDVVTGLIKANLPARISFRLSSKNDSRTIFDTMGAERLVGNGDMLFMPPGESRLLRMHGAYISESEIEAITNHWRGQGEPEYRDEILIDPEEAEGAFADDSNHDDPLYREAVDLAVTSGFVSASMLQRRFRVGYNRAARLVEQMESQGIVGPAEGSRPRPIISPR